MRKGALLATLAVLAGVVVAPGVAADPAFTVRTMHFDVLAGPGAGQHCDIVGDLYTPASAGAASPATAGAAKITWALLFVFEGALLENIDHPEITRAIGCPNFPDQVCTDLLLTGTLGYPTPDTVALLRHASVASYVSKIRIPTLLI